MPHHSYNIPKNGVQCLQGRRQRRPFAGPAAADLSPAAGADQATQARHPLEGSHPSQKNLLLHKDEDDYASIRSSIASRRLASSLQDSIKNPNLIEQKKEEIGVRSDEKDNEGSLREKCTKNDTKDSPREEGKAKIEEAVTDDEEEDDNDDKRRIGYHEDDESGPGSPSFRVYFDENGDDCSNGIGKKRS
ncbi:UNVERIFIED_CONTAM: hypothetical protein Sangu_2047800 [Sesamum angustifolium]|uniref:Uncharacterized protein n=1 Tax=Sesamum angustifolium TaxID=2727405 RepID=A0AAW2LIQ6_9LAMI